MYWMQYYYLELPPWLSSKVAQPTMQETWVQSLDLEDPLEEGMATHYSILSWRIPWTEESGRLQSIWSQRVRHNWSDWALMHEQGGTLPAWLGTLIFSCLGLELTPLALLVLKPLDCVQRGLGFVCVCVCVCVCMCVSCSVGSDSLKPHRL